MLKLEKNKNFNNEFIYQIFKEQFIKDSELKERYEKELKNYISVLSLDNFYNLNQPNKDTNLLLYIIYKIHEEKYNNYINLDTIEKLVLNKSPDYIFTTKDLLDYLNELKNKIIF